MVDGWSVTARSCHETAIDGIVWYSTGMTNLISDRRNSHQGPSDLLAHAHGIERCPAKKVANEI